MRLLSLICVLLAISSSLVWAQDGTAGLVGKWLFEDDQVDPATQVVSDSSGNGNDGTLMEGAVWLGGDLGGVKLDGVAAYVDVNHSDSLAITRELTLATWIYFRAGGQYDGIITKGTENLSWSMMSGRDSQLRFYGNNRPEGFTNRQDVFGAGPQDTSMQIPVGEWSHLGITSNGAQLAFYVNGDSEILDRAYRFGITDQSLTFGVDLSDAGITGNPYVDCDLDDVHIYNRAISAGEMFTLWGGKTEAFGPEPVDGAEQVSSSVLRWYHPEGTTSAKIYVGTASDNLAKVADVDGDTTTFNLPNPQPAQAYYWRVDITAENGEVTGPVWRFTTSGLTAGAPVPADGGAAFPTKGAALSWSPAFGAQEHDVYLGTDRAAVAAATTDSPEYQGRQTANSYLPDTLENELDYYWRIDEIMGDASILTGDVWSFKTRPVVLVDPNLVTWLRFDEGYGRIAPDWSGHNNPGIFSNNPEWVMGYEETGGLSLNAGHDAKDGDYQSIASLTLERTIQDDLTVMCWLKTTTSGTGANAGPAYQGSNIIYSDLPGVKDDFNLSLTQDHLAWFIGNPDTTVHSLQSVTDGEWTHVAGTRRATDGTMEIYINGVLNESTVQGNTNPLTASAVILIGTHSNRKHRFFTGVLDEIKLFNSVRTQEQIIEDMVIDPLKARNPRPANGSLLDPEQDVTLAWDPGKEAVAHRVYFGTDPNTLEFQAEQPEQDYAIGLLAPGMIYYWRIDEVLPTGEIARGVTWRFTVVSYLILDDMEAYGRTDADLDAGLTAPWDVWLDGYGGNGTGSTTGHNESPYMASDSPNPRSKASLPLQYNNTGSFFDFEFKNNNAKHSEIVRTFDPAQDFTRRGVTTLILWFAGSVDNLVTGADNLYVALEDSTGQVAVVPYSGSSDDLMLDTWQQWNIDLAQVSGIDLTSIRKIMVGVGDRNNPILGGVGTVLIDDLRLDKLN